MNFSARSLLIALLAALQCGCGVAVPEIAEVWDRYDPKATEHMEKQIRLAIYCELRDAVTLARSPLAEQDRYFYKGKEVTTPEDLPLPDDWGAQVTLTFTVDESTKLSPGVSLKTPVHTATTNFVGEAIGVTGLAAAASYGPLVVPQSYAFGLGGVLSSDANRIDIFDTYYAMKEMAHFDPAQNICAKPPAPEVMGPASNSSPFLIESNLGIKEWLPQAVSVSSFLRTSRAAESGVGPALGSASGAFAPDTLSYHIKFTVLSSLNATPQWNLVRVSANTGASLLDTGRTRTHELLITIGLGAKTTPAAPKPGKAPPAVAHNVALSQEAAALHQAQLIGSAVANAIRSP